MASTEPDRILLAQITGAASRYARQPRLSGLAREAAVAELAAVASGRRDLLAEHAGIIVGAHEGDLDEERYLRTAQLCIDAGADVTQIPRWIAEGRRRARDTQARRSSGR